MNYLFYLNLLCLIAYFHMLVFTLTRSSKSLKNTTGIALFSCIILWNLGWALVQNPYVSINAARWFINISAVGGISFGGCFLWFTFFFIEKEKIIKTKLFYLLVFLVPLLLIFMQIRYNSIISIHGFSKYIYGWEFILHTNIWTAIYGIYTFLSIATGFYLALRYRKNAKNDIHKKLTTLIVFTAIIAAAFGTFGVFLVFLQRGLMFIPYLGNIFFLIWACGLFYVMNRYKFFSFTPRSAAQHIIETMSDSLLLIDINDKIRFANPAILSLLGYTENELINKPVDFILGETPIQKEELKKLIHAGPVDNVEINYRAKEGRIIPVLFSSSIMFNNETTAYGLVCIAHDISNLKQIQDELQRVQKLQSLGILAGGIAHDFNNLLSGVFGYIELAKKSTTPDQRIYRYLENALSSFDSAKNLAQQLLTFAKGSLPAKKVSSIESIITNATKFALSGSNIDCTFKFEDDLWPVEVDQTQINQVFNNIIINARQAMINSGFIEIEVKNAFLKPTDKYQVEKNKYVQISVTDYGTGIPEADLPKIFDPFFTTRQSGVGLGLTICHSIIKNHGGHINVNSTHGVGTTIIIYLPASEEKIVGTEVSTLSPDLKDGWKILLMDDEDFLLGLLQEILVDMGNTVELTKNGEEAISKYIQAFDSGKKFDIVIFDLTVPGGMGGKMAIEQLLQIDPKVKGVASSGYSEDPIFADPEAYGFSGAIKKPFMMDELHEVLHRVMN